MREIEITYTNVKIDEVIVELARYIEQGYKITSWCTSLSYSSWDGDKCTVTLVKY